MSLPRRFVRRLVAVAAVPMLLTACFTGERPQFAVTPIGGNPGSPTGNAAADAVLALLEGDPVVPLTATYEVTRNMGPVTTPAVVAEDGTRRSVTIGRVRYLQLGSIQTCDLDAGTCASGLVDERVSDTGVTNGFDASVPARRLRIAVARATGEITGSHEEIAGQDATCVTVPQGSGSELYCALPVGVIGRWLAGDVTIQLTSLSDTVDDAAFSTVD
ncbi:MAG: hypothetical protein R2715_10500 [Ilumatobacteraceae bacterium]